LEWDPKDNNPDHWLSSNFPARYIYEKILPDVVKEYAPTVFYHPGSPWGKGKATSDSTVGDIHQWNGISVFRKRLG
jgi:beta-mannosidase